MSQSDINIESYTIFNKWDELLNEVYQYLKTIMPKDEFVALEKDELKWIEEKENAMSKAAAEWEGGSGAPMAVNMAGTEYTKERCYYLISLINK